MENIRWPINQKKSRLCFYVKEREREKKNASPPSTIPEMFPIVCDQNVFPFEMFYKLKSIRQHARERVPYAKIIFVDRREYFRFSKFVCSHQLQTSAKDE